MSKITLYDYWRSSSSYRVRIALNLKNLDYQFAPINLLLKEHQQDAHIARNPQGLVPVLAYDALQLTQSIAIIEFLDEAHPSPPLLPSNADDRARVRAIIYAIAMEIHPICNLSVVNHVAEISKHKDIKQRWMQRYISQGLGAVEQLLDHPATGKFCHGDNPSIADCTLIPQLYNAERWQVDVSGFPRIVEIARACAETPAFIRAHPNQIGPPAT